MKKQVEEKVLLFNFQNEDNLAKLQEVLKGLHIKPVVADLTMQEQVIGHLLGLKGFGPREVVEGEDFGFPYEFMMFKDVTQPRYRQIIKAIQEAELPIPPCKAVLTPTNRFWTLKKICLQMAKEHLSQMKG